MHIAINLRLFIKGEIGGLENYVRNVVAGVAAAQRDAEQPLTIFCRRSEIENLRALAPQAQFLPVAHSTAEACTAAELEVGDYDVLFCPLLVLEPGTTSVPSAVMVPDLLHEFHPDFFTADLLAWRRQRYGPSVEKASVVFTLSEDAKRSIVERFGVEREKVVVVHLDVDDEFRRPVSHAARRAVDGLDLPAEFLYYPANFWPHKNHDRLLQAMVLLRERFPSLHLVLTGAEATGVDRVRARVASLGLDDRVRLLGYQPRELLPEIYRRASMLVFPSRFEGFGIPILEAFNVGTPAVVANSHSCPEIAGDAALLIDAMDPAAIAAGVTSVIEDPRRRSDLVAKGRARASAFAWDKAVDLTLRCLADLAPGRPPRALEVVDRPVVSVVTPSFNMARYIEETIQSVLGQDYPHIDYIVMDGGSTDGTQEILRKYEDKLRYRSEPDGGQGDAVNKGFLLSRGRIFAFLNADDTYLPGAVGKAVRQLVENPSAGVVYGEGFHVFEDGRVIDRYPSRPFSPETFIRNCYICQPTAFMWSDVFESAGMVNPGVIALDYDLWIRISQGGHAMVYVEDELATSRMYGDNKTLRARGDVYRDIIAVVKRSYGYVPYDWLFGYACYLVDRKDQFFEPTASSRLKLLVSLALGVVHNPRHLRRYVREWAGQAGLIPSYSGRWEDGWISRHYAEEFAVGQACDLVRIAGRHLGPRRLELSVRLDGEALGSKRLSEGGSFLLEYPCPHQLRGGSRLLEIECSSSFRSRHNGDRRHLSCIVDTIEFVAHSE